MGEEKIMEFKSKTALQQHISELVDSGYLKSHWEMRQVNGGTSGRKYYTINFEAVKTD